MLETGQGDDRVDQSESRVKVVGARTATTG